MEFLRVTGGNRLDGRLKIASAKNAVLPIIACALLAESEIKIKNCPRLSDITAMMKIIRSTGGRADFEGDDIVLDCSNANPSLIESDLTGGIRSSIFILGPILARFKRAAVSYPGGCEIGLRPIDLHIYGLKQLNVRITEENGHIVCDGSAKKSGEIDLDFPSVGATENIMMAAVYLGGRSIIRNAAREPEIVNLAEFLNCLGGRVFGAGSDTIIIEGVKALHGGEFTPIPDRIVGGTYLTACALTGGDVYLENLRSDSLNAVIEKLARAGAEITRGSDFIRLRSKGRINAIHKIETQPYPGFPTDMQAQIAALLARADGCSVMVENLFENRYKYTVQLNKMGAKITVKDRIAVIKGVKKLYGTAVSAEDLRGGAALVLAALGAEGESIVSGVAHIDRGYCHIEDDLKALGADITRECKNQ